MARTPRKIKKAAKSVRVIYDISALPMGSDVDQVFYVYHKTGVLFYDSKRGEAPKFQYNNKRTRIRDTSKVMGAYDFGRKQRL